MVSVTSKGDWSKTTDFLNNAKNPNLGGRLAALAQEGVDRLKEATPVRTGRTANSWEYELSSPGGQIEFSWGNTHIEKGWANIAQLLNDGHGTRNGGYVAPRNYIDPAIQPVMDEMIYELWKEVAGDVG